MARTISFPQCFAYAFELGTRVEKKSAKIYESVPPYNLVTRPWDKAVKEPANWRNFSQAVCLSHYRAP